MIFEGVNIDLGGYRRIGIKLSGGADSALVLFLSCTTITEEKLDVEYIQPFTVQLATKPWQFYYSQQVIDWMRERFPNIEIKPPLTNKAEVKTEYGPKQEEVILANISQIDVLLNGITANPPKEESVHFHEWEWRDKDRDVRRVEKTFGMVPRMYPVINFDKKKIAELYKDLDIMDLFAVTRSCEGYERWDEHCGKCWWCDERKWAFGRLV